MITLIYVVLTLSLFIALIRLVKGPHLVDRVVALELMASIVVGFVGVHVVDTGVTSLLDVAIVIALMGFLAAIAFARYIEREGIDNE